jgi:hypothetical protein
MYNYKDISVSFVKDIKKHYKQQHKTIQMLQMHIYVN